ncbi:MAG TPA: family 78 glycoside hydrolase catalytic domain [Verrucomicrobiae bacterium]|nr:family 78 glycoside hydrolase catalytic domain [Verrucomicrobiae bacterium]
MKTFSVGLALVLAVIILPLTARTAPAALAVNDLRCEDLKDPQGIDLAQPRLSWVLESRERGQRQTAYEILVATSEKNLAQNIGDCWSSGQIRSDQSVQVPYAGQPLVSGAEYFWKVRVWDGEGRVSAWSRPAHWSMGLLNPADWSPAQWIGLDGQDTTNYLAGADWIWFPAVEAEKPMPGTVYFRKVIVLPAGRRILHARWVYTGDNECRGWLNGDDLGARNNYRTVKDNDITGRLEPGTTNVFACTGSHFGTNANPAGIVGLLTIEFDSGPPLIVPTDNSWKVSDTEKPGWNQVGFNDSNWVPAQTLGPVGMAPWGRVRVAESRVLPARYLRKEFAIEKPIRRATVYFSGLGLSELYLNGRKIGDAVLSPAFAQYNRRAFYVTYNVTRYLRRGPNALGVILGNGRFYADRSQVYAGTKSFGWPKLLLQLRVEYADGSVEKIVSDGSWMLTTNGPIRANNDFDGEEYDARREMPGWDRPGFDAAGWQPVQIVSAPCSNLSAQMQNPIRVTAIIKPISIREISPGVFIYDLGQNIAGWCRLKVSGPAGTRVVLRHAETLKPDGELDRANLRGAQATDVYLLKGQGTEIWEPRFVTHGFRYVEVTGFPGRPSLNSIEGCVVNDDLPVTGHFLCSNDLLNHIYSNVVWGVRDNYRSIPTDCPQRDERQGWLGDRSEESRGESYFFDNSTLYAKWMQDIADAQRPGGSVPDVAPAYWPIYSDNVSWPSTFIIVPEMLRDQFADTRTFARQYDAQKKWMNYMSRWVTNGLIARDSYGDWCVPPEDPRLIHTRDTNRITDKTLIATAYFYHDCQLMENDATLLGKTGDAAAFRALAEKLRAAFNEKFLDRAQGQYSNGTQTSCILPLAFGLVPEDMKARIFANLVGNIENQTHDHIGTGLIGGQYLMRVLTENGRPDLAYEIATQRDYPSWGYMVEHGATTIWELWNGNTADPGMNSHNHVMLVGDLVVWLYEDLAGIAPDPAQPGFKHILMRPTPVGDLKFVQAWHNSPYGKISSAWCREGRRFDWRIEIPPNTTASVFVPVDSSRRVKADGVRPVRFETDRAVFQLGSGQYHFLSEIP